MNASKPNDQSPITPAVTRIHFPSPTESYPDRGRQQAAYVNTGPGLSSSSNDSAAPITPADIDSLDQLWGNLRLEKERKMAKDPVKIKSFEEGHALQVETDVAIPPPQVLKRQNSLASFRESADGKSVTATFDMPGLQKQDIHVSFQRNRLVVTWENVNITEREEDGRIVRERREKTYNRTIPLPEGTKFEEIRAAMDTRRLVLKYPNIRAVRQIDSRGDLRNRDGSRYRDGSRPRAELYQRDYHPF